MDLPTVMIHALSVDKRGDATAHIRGTIRYGDPEPGATLFFRDPAGREHEVTLRERIDHKRIVELIVDGPELAPLEKGRFLYGR